MNKILRNNNKKDRTSQIVASVKATQEAVKIAKAIEKESSLLASWNEMSIERAWQIAVTASEANIGTISNDNSIIISLAVSTYLAKKALMKTFKIDESEVGTDKYVGIVAKEATSMEDLKKYCTDNEKVLISLVYAGIEDELIEEIKRCDLNDKDNLKKIYWDFNVVYRMYQEMQIDSAKKAINVEIKIIIEGYRPLSLQKYTHKFDYANKKIEITQKGVNTEDDTATRQDDCILFQDPINDIQEVCVQTIVTCSNEMFAAEVIMSDEESTRLQAYKGEGPVKDLMNNVKPGYAALTGQHQEILAALRLYTDKDSNEESIKLENKRFTKALSVLKTLPLQLLDGYTDNEACSILQSIACTDSNGVFDRRSGSQLATSLLSEKYLSMILENEAKVKVMGYKININNGLKIGDQVEFINGVCYDNGSLLHFKKEIGYANGIFRIEEFKGSLYAVKDLEFNSPKPDYSKRVFFVRKKSIKMEISEIEEMLQEGSVLVVDAYGDIKSRGMKVASVNCAFDSVATNGNTINDLINVRGTVSYLNIVESKVYGPTIMFELSDVVELDEEEECIMSDVVESGNTIVVEDAQNEKDYVMSDPIDSTDSEAAFDYDELEEQLEEEEQFLIDNFDIN